MTADKKNITWDLFEKDAKKLAQILQDHGPWEGVVGIARGGLVATAIIANAINIRNVKTVAVTSYEGQTITTAEMLNSVEKIHDGAGWVFIDDLVDTGQTAELIKRYYPKAKLAVVYAKPAGKAHADFSSRDIEQDIWLNFPWE